MSTQAATKRAVQATATKHLAALHPGHDRAMTAWSVGALEVSHAATMHAYLRDRDPQVLAPIDAGSFTSEYQYRADASGIQVSGGTPSHTTRVRWREIADLMAPILRRSSVADEIAAAVAERVRLTGLRDEQFFRWQRGLSRGRDVGLDEAWDAVERRCYQLAAEVWAACRPDEQAALFEL